MRPSERRFHELQAKVEQATLASTIIIHDNEGYERRYVRRDETPGLWWLWTPAGRKELTGVEVARDLLNAVISGDSQGTAHS